MASWIFRQCLPGPGSSCDPEQILLFLTLTCFVLLLWGLMSGVENQSFDLNGKLDLRSLLDLSLVGVFGLVLWGFLFFLASVLQKWCYPYLLF